MKVKRTGERLWAKAFDVPSHYTEDNGNWTSDVSADSTGNAYAVGSAYGTGNNGTGFVTKFNPSGKQLWKRQFDSLRAVGTCLEISKTKEIYVGGGITSGYHLALGGSSWLDKLQNYLVERRNSNEIKCSGEEDGFVAAYDTSGNQSWFSKLITVNSDRVQALALDVNDNVYAVLSADTDCMGKIQRGGVSIAKLNKRGCLLWVKEAVAGPSMARDIAVDNNGNIYLSGCTIDPNTTEARAFICRIRQQN
jgi:hypothetical protein